MSIVNPKPTDMTIINSSSVSSAISLDESKLLIDQMNHLNFNCDQLPNLIYHVQLDSLQDQLTMCGNIDSLQLNGIIQKLHENRRQILLNNMNGALEKFFGCTHDMYQITEECIKLMHVINLIINEFEHDRAMIDRIFFTLRRSLTSLVIQGQYAKHVVETVTSPIIPPTVTFEPVRQSVPITPFVETSNMVKSNDFVEYSDSDNDMPKSGRVRASSTSSRNSSPTPKKKLFSFAKKKNKTPIDNGSILKEVIKQGGKIE